MKRFLNKVIWLLYADTMRDSNRSTPVKWLKALALEGQSRNRMLRGVRRRPGGPKQDVEGWKANPSCSERKLFLPKDSSKAMRLLYADNLRDSNRSTPVKWLKALALKEKSRNRMLRGVRRRPGRRIPPAPRESFFAEGFF